MEYPKINVILAMRPFVDLALSNQILHTLGNNKKNNKKKENSVVRKDIKYTKRGLVNQINYLKWKVQGYDPMISDVGSGLDMKRKGFQSY